MATPCPTATAIADDVRHERARARDAVDAALARIHEREAHINAWAHLDENQAHAIADAIDATGRDGRLAGVPVGVKDIIDTADMPTENGTELEAGRRPDADATVVRRLRAAGAVIIGKTVTTELACGMASVTRNPHAPDHTPGGSSSGSAATVAAGGAPLTLGSQTAGSVIRPAAFCGVWALKPSFGLIPRTGSLTLSRTLDHLGVFGRAPADLARAVDVLSGDDGADPDTEGMAPSNLEAALMLPLGAPRLAFVRGPEWAEVEPACVPTLEDAAAQLGAAWIDLGPEFGDANAVHRALMRREIAHNFRARLGDAITRLSRTIQEHVAGGEAIDAMAYLALCDRVRTMRAAFARLMRRYDAVLTIASPGEAPEGLSFTGSRRQTLLWTMLGVPAVNVPALRGPQGLPLGLQVVGAMRDDAGVLRAAAWVGERLRSEGTSLHDG